MLSADKDWTLAMRERTRSVIEALRRHPWAVGLMEGRAKPGPANLQHHNDVLGCLRGAGFSPKDSVHVMSLFDSFMYGFALQQRSLALDSREDFQDAAVRQSTQVAALAERFPTSPRSSRDTSPQRATTTPKSLSSASTC